MSINACLNSALEQGEINEREAEMVRALYEGYRQKAKAGSTADADLTAQAKTAERLAADAKQKKRRTLLQAKAQKRIVADTLAYRTSAGEEDIAEGSIALIEHFGTAPYSSLEGLRKSIVGKAHADMVEVLRKFERTKVLGRTPDRAALDNVVREAFGENTGDAAAKGLAQAWDQVSDGLRQRFNRAGGAIGKLENWGLPQTHDPQALLKAGRATWKETIRARLDLSKMRHPETGDEILDFEINDILDDVWSEIVTQGWASKTPNGVPAGRGALAGQRAEHRFLIFKSADDWLAYQKDFGQGDPFGSMMQHINMMARDIAAIERLGPNPQASITFLGQRIKKAGAAKLEGKGQPFAGKAANAENRATRRSQELVNMWDGYRGNLEVPVDSVSASAFAATRNWLTSAILGGAVISAVPTDPMYQVMARRFTGIPAFNTLFDMVKPMAKSNRMEAVRSGLILDSAMHVLGTQARYLGTLSGPEWSRWLPDRVMAWQGLSAWTQAARHSFGLSFQGMLADRANMSLGAMQESGKDTLEAATARTLERWGFTADDWDVIRSATAHKPDGASFLRPQEIAAVDERLAERVLEMILSETEHAVPSSSLRGRTGMRGATKPGTLWGEVARSAGMFRSFAVTYALLYGSRAYRLFGANKAAGAKYVSALLLTTAIGGAMSLWMKDIAAGRDPRPIFGKDGNPLGFMGQAFMQGGGLGILGDFLLADLNRYGGGLAGTIGGPVAELGTDFTNLTVGNAVQFATGEDTKALEDARRFVHKATPGRSLWFLRLAYDRVLMDNLRRLTDPDAEKAFSRRGRFIQELGTDTWWSPGHNAPERAPDLDVLREGPSKQ